jgi:uncharacterized membrane protein
MQSTWLFIGLAFIAIGLLIIVISSFLTKTESEWGFGGFIGPFPFGFASNQTMLYITIILTVLLVVLSLALVWLK